MSWTEERLERCKQLWLEGHSASEIAADIGGLTRNAVIGKVHRLGLKRADGVGRHLRVRPVRAHVLDRPVLKLKKAPPVQPKAPNKYRRVGNGKGNSSLEVFPWGPGDGLTDLPVEEVASALPLFDLQFHHCRWPVSGEGERAMFCAATAVLDKPYCPDHCRVAYRKAYRTTVQGMALAHRMRVRSRKRRAA